MVFLDALWVKLIQTDVSSKFVTMIKAIYSRKAV